MRYLSEFFGISKKIKIIIPPKKQKSKRKCISIDKPFII